MNGIYDEVWLVLYVIWMWCWLVLVVVWGVCVLGWFFVLQILSWYELCVWVFVQLQLILFVSMDQFVQISQINVDMICQILILVVNLEKVVCGIDLVNIVLSDCDVVDCVVGFVQSIKVMLMQDNLFEIIMILLSLKFVWMIMQKLIDIFVEQNLVGDCINMIQSLIFFDKQLEQCQKQLQDVEFKCVDFQNCYFGSLFGIGLVSDWIGVLWV